MSVAFLASFPPIQSAIKIGQDGMRLQLDVPEREMANAVEVLTLRGEVLRVTIEKQTETNGEPELATRQKRKSERTTT